MEMSINVFAEELLDIFSKDNSMTSNAINANKTSLITRLFGGGAKNVITMFVPNAKDIRKIHVHSVMPFIKRRLKKKDFAMFANKILKSINPITHVHANSISAHHAINDSQ